VSGFNLSERNIVVLNLLIGLAIIPFLALSATDLFKLHLANGVLPEESEYARLAPARFGGGTHPRTYYNPIVARDIFNLAPPPEAAPVENETMDVKLIGTSQISAGKPYAIIEDANGKQSLYRVGEQVPDAGQLVEVANNRAVVLHNGHRVAIEIPREGLTPGARLTPRPRPGLIRRPPGHGVPGLRVPGRGIRRMGTNRYMLDRSTVNSNLKNMAPLFTQIRATPQIENGVAHGFRLTEIQPDSIFQQIGLQNGDLLNAVNGQSVGDPAKALVMLQSLQTMPAITLDVVRNGAPTQLHYNIR
jgi:general secretion pathway protein C